MNEQVTIITGAVPIPTHVKASIGAGDIVLAADGGLDHALAAGIHPSGVIGDMDSVSDEGLRWAAANATITRHPTDKNQTDTELALELAATMDPDRVTLIGGGDRLDHTISGIGALGNRRLTSIPELTAWWGGQHVRVLHGPGQATVAVEPGSTISLLALHGPCSGVVIKNVRWELDGVDLDPAVGWGISNEAVSAADGGAQSVDVKIAVSTGVLTIFDHPVIARGAP